MKQNYIGGRCGFLRGLNLTRLFLKPEYDLSSLPSCAGEQLSNSLQIEMPVVAVDLSTPESPVKCFVHSQPHGLTLAKFQTSLPNRLEIFISNPNIIESKALHFLVDHFS